GRVAVTSAGGSALWVRDLGDNELLYTAEQEGELPTLVTLQHPVLSADGSVLTYWRATPIDGVPAALAGQAVVVDLATGAQTLVPREVGGGIVRLSLRSSPSADGSLVAYKEALIEGIEDPVNSTTTVGVGLWNGQTATTVFTSESIEANKLVLTADGTEILFSD